MSLRWLALLGLFLLLSATACFEPKFVRLRNFDVHLEPDPQLPWKAQLSEFARLYEASPGLSAGNERFTPIFGGLTTLAYFGSDLDQKLLDQRIPKGVRHVGHDLESACAQPEPAGAARDQQPGTDDDRLASAVEPDFDALWIPVPIDTGLLPADARCDERGAPRTGTGRYFCMFGRLALHAGARPLVLVIHGMFDSSAQLYVRNLAAALFGQGYSTLLLDMRDHGETFRAAPSVPATLGHLEAQDILAVARMVHRSCAAHVSAVGAVGVSGGGLDAITAYADDGRDGNWWLDAGAVAFSPLLDIGSAMQNIEDSKRCSTLQAVELTWGEHLALGALGASTFFAGAAIAEAANGERLDERTAIAAGIGAVSGIGLGLFVDAVADGDSATSQGCVGRGAIAALFDDLLHERWRTLIAQGDGVLTGQARKISPQNITLATYLSQRVDPYYGQRGVRFDRYTPARLSAALHAREELPGSSPAKLLILGADDDPVTLSPALHAFARRTASMPRVHVIAVRYGGHGAFWIVQQRLTKELLGVFFGRPTP